MIKNKKVVVTGGAGFIGSNLSRELSKANEVVIFDNLAFGRYGNISDIVSSKKAAFVKGDIRNLDALKKVVRSADYVFHNAAVASVPISINDPLMVNDVNTNGTLNVLVAAKDSNVSKVVFASSCAVYSDQPIKRKTEKLKTMPKSPYAVTKVFGEDYLKIFYELYGLKTVSLRYFNVFGPRQNPNSDYAAVVPRFISNTLSNKPIKIFGDGMQTRDFVFVSDIVNANILACEKNAADGEIINIASGKSTSINTLAKKIIEICYGKIMPKYEKAREGEVRHSLADIGKARKLLGYEPSFTLDEGLKRTADFLKN